MVAWANNILRALRPHQWSKNLLLFVPAVLGHEIADPSVAGAGVLAFIAFSLVASAGYLVNDMKDLAADRSHPSKRMRPIASGKVTLPTAAVTAGCLTIGGLTLGAWLSPVFLAGLVFYGVLTVSYSLGLKTWALVDIFLLAAMYMLRIYAGGWATEIPISHWLASFSLFFFLSLGILKRVAEIHSLEAQGRTMRRRGYLASDLSLLTGLGLSTACVSVLVIVLYASSDQVRVLYARPEVLWLVAVPIFFWLSRVWLVTARKKMHDDPILFALRDPVSYLIVIFVGSILLLAGPLTLGL